MKFNFDRICIKNILNWFSAKLKYYFSRLNPTHWQNVTNRDRSDRAKMTNLKSVLKTCCSTFLSQRKLRMEVQLKTLNEVQLCGKSISSKKNQIKLLK